MRDALVVVFGGILAGLLAACAPSGEPRASTARWSPPARGFAGYADHGYDATEPDNLDAWTRSHGRLTRADSAVC